jgi:hypothetical protein
LQAIVDKLLCGPSCVEPISGRDGRPPREAAFSSDGSGGQQVTTARMQAFIFAI